MPRYKQTNKQRKTHEIEKILVRGAAVTDPGFSAGGTNSGGGGGSSNLLFVKILPKLHENERNFNGEGGVRP